MQVSLSLSLLVVVERGRKEEQPRPERRQKKSPPHHPAGLVCFARAREGPTKKKKKKKKKRRTMLVPSHYTKKKCLKGMPEKHVCFAADLFRPDVPHGTRQNLGPGTTHILYKRLTSLFKYRLPNHQRWSAKWKLSRNVYALHARFFGHVRHRIVCSVGDY